jgi:hypothetical protein
VCRMQPMASAACCHALLLPVSSSVHFAKTVSMPSQTHLLQCSTNQAHYKITLAAPSVHAVPLRCVQALLLVALASAVSRQVIPSAPL